MTTSNRAAQLAKLHRVLKKHYRPVTPIDRPLLQILLYASCLQVANHDSANQAFARLEEVYFDWNEVRVTTVSELSEIMDCLPNASAAAARLKRTLQAVFEAYYAFEIESLKKENIGQAVKKLQQLDGITPFAIAYATQNGLGGHAIAVNASSLEVLRLVGVISDKEAAQKRVPGLERAISKSKGIEFGSLLHQLGVDYAASRFSPRVRAIILEVDPDAKQRLPKRGGRKKKSATKAAGSKTTPKSSSKSGSKSGNKKSPSKPTKKSTRETKSVKQNAPAKRKKSQSGKSAKASSRKSTTRSTAKKSPTKRLTKKKPR